MSDDRTGGNDGEGARGTGVSEELTALRDALAREIGPENTEQVAEYIEHHEFGLALELIVSLAIRHGLDGRPHEAAVRDLFGKMEMADSPYAADWDRHLAGGA